MTIILTLIHIAVCVFLIGVVLLQSGKAADLAGAFGGMGSQTAFGPRGSATMLSKATTLAAGLFMVSSLFLAIVETRNASSGGSVLDRTKKSAPKSNTVKTAAPSVTVNPNGGAPSGQPIPLNFPPPPQGGQAPAPVKP